jgi:hypothetical protein
MIKQALDAHAKTATKTREHDRLQTVGASEVGQCSRKVFWAKNDGDQSFGVAPDAEYHDGWGAKARGSVYENEFWVPAIKAAFGADALYVGADQKTFVSGFLSGTPDGLLINQKRNALAHLGVADIESDCIDLDCKTADPRTNLSQPKPEHVFQMHVQLGLIRELTDYQPTYALLSYTDASFWDLVIEFPIRFDPKIYETAKARAATIMTATNATDLKPEGWIAGGNECRYCPFTRPCGIARQSVPTQDTIPDAQFVAEITDMAMAVKQLEDAVGSNEARLREAQQEIKDRLREKSVRKIPGVVTWSTVKGRQSYDQKAIREAAVQAGVDIEQYSTVGEPTDRLQITLKTNSASTEADKPQAVA